MNPTKTMYTAYPGTSFVRKAVYFTVAIALLFTMATSIATLIEISALKADKLNSDDVSLTNLYHQAGRLNISVSVIDNWRTQTIGSLSSILTNLANVGGSLTSLQMIMANATVRLSLNVSDSLSSLLDKNQLMNLTVQTIGSNLLITNANLTSTNVRLAANGVADALTSTKLDSFVNTLFLTSHSTNTIVEGVVSNSSITVTDVVPMNITGGTSGKVYGTVNLKMFWNPSYGRMWYVGNMYITVNANVTESSINLVPANATQVSEMYRFGGCTALFQHIPPLGAASAIGNAVFFFEVLKMYSYYYDRNVVYTYVDGNPYSKIYTYPFYGTCLTRT